jgi:thymidine phosphorylase
VVRGGEPVLTLHTDEPERFERALDALDGAFDIAPAGARPDLPPLVIDRISPSR